MYVWICNECLSRGKTDTEEKKDKGYKSADDDDDDDDEKSADSKEKKSLQDKLSGSYLNLDVNTGYYYTGQLGYVTNCILISLTRINVISI